MIPGYYADPSLVQHDGKFFVYATLDPWGGDTLGCWESGDFQHWTYRFLNWPTVETCVSSTATKTKVWAPSVVRARDGRFYMYVSVGGEVWAGVAEHPLGPWRGISTCPMIAADYHPEYHMIDAEAFMDDDGSAWLYWGSGLNWINGRSAGRESGELF
jgi:beta-xylosidase